MDRSNKKEKVKDSNYNVFKTSEKYENKDKIFMCWLCSGNHKVSVCPEITVLSHAEKIKLVKDKNLCFNCLSNTHLINNCISKFSCRVSNCGKRHHTILHQYTPASTDNIDESNNKRESATDTQGNINKISSYLKPVYLQIIPVTLVNKGTVVKTNAQTLVQIQHY